MILVGRVIFIKPALVLQCIMVALLVGQFISLFYPSAVSSSVKCTRKQVAAGIAWCFYNDLITILIFYIEYRCHFLRKGSTYINASTEIFSPD